MVTATLAMATAVDPDGADLEAALLVEKCAAEPAVAVEEGGDVEGHTRLWWSACCKRMPKFSQESIVPNLFLGS